MGNQIFTDNKIFCHLDKVNQWLKKGNTIPICVELDVTNKCNFKCPHCAGFRDNQVELDSNFGFKIIKQLKEFGVKGIIFTGGGEPLCHSRILDFLAFTSSLGLEIGFITNGSLVSDKSFKLVSMCDWIRVSLDSSNKKEFKKLHGVDMFEQTIKNISELTKAKKTSNSKCVIGLAFLIDNYLKNNMDKMVLLSKSLGVDYAQFRPFHYGKTKITEKEMEKLKVYNTFNFKVLYSKHKYTYLFEKRPYDICYGHHFTTTICADGKVYLCCHLRANPRYCLGDLKKESFRKIWSSKQRKKVYENIDFKDCPPVCRCDPFNRILFKIKSSQEQIHKTFL